MKKRKTSSSKSRKFLSARKKRSSKPKVVKPRVISGIKVPSLMQLVSVYLHVRDVDSVVEFYLKAFGFKKKFTMPGPDGKTVHAELLHANCTIMIGTPPPDSGSMTPKELGGSAATVYVYVKNVDAIEKRARAAGAEIVRKLKDEFWGDRVVGIKDPGGHQWYFATVKRIVPPGELHP